MIEKETKCKECGKIHKNEDFSDLAEVFVDEVFPMIWKQGKSDLKEMSKKEVAEQMYFLGVKHFMQEVHHNLEAIKKDLED